MILLPLGVLWAGYTLGWFGWGTLHFPGPGLLDLVIPGRSTNIAANANPNGAGIAATTAAISRAAPASGPFTQTGPPALTQVSGAQ